MSLADLFKNNSTVLSPQDAKIIIEGSDKFVLLDVRTQAEYDEARIPGATLIPVDELGNRAAGELLDKRIPILVYCRSGGRAGRAVQLLTEMGYAKARNIGGITTWPYKTIKR